MLMMSVQLQLEERQSDLSVFMETMERNSMQVVEWYTCMDFVNKFGGYVIHFLFQHPSYVTEVLNLHPEDQYIVYLVGYS